MIRKGIFNSTFISLVFRGTVLFLAVSLLVVLCIIGDYAWRAETEKTNKFSNEAAGQYSVILTKVEKDTIPVDSVPIAGAEFYLYNGSGNKVGAGSYLTQDDGTIQVPGLKEGSYYFEEVAPAFAYTYDTTADGDLITRYYFDVNTLTVDEDLTVHVRAYNKRVTAPLTITKLVENNDGSPLTQEQLDTAFAFKIYFSDDKIYNYRVDGVGSQIPIASGDLFELKHGQSIVFDAIPTGVQYTVDEVDSKGYLVRSKDHQGTMLEEGRTVGFTNTLLTESGSLIITKKICEGPGPADTSASFDFTLEFGNLPSTPVIVYVNGNPVELSIPNNRINITLKHNEQTEILNLPVGATYTISEKDYSDEGYIPAPLSYTGQIIEGTLTIPFVNSPDNETGTFGSLLIAKHVVSLGGGELTDAQRQQPFSFTITFTGLPDEPTTVLFDGKDTEISAANNQLSFDLKHGEDMYIEGIPALVGYLVEEKPAAGYVAGIDYIEGNIPRDHIAILDFYNQVQVAKKSTSLTIKKVIEGEVPSNFDNASFHFTLEVDNQVVREFDLKADESITIGDLPEGYSYCVREEDRFKDSFALMQVTNGSGILTDDEQIVQFTNEYVARIMVAVTGEKFWDLAGQDVELPAFIGVNLKERGAVVSTLKVMPDEDGRWLYSFCVPKYDEDGNELDYVIEEDNIPGWWVQYDGYNIVNTCVIPLTIESPVLVKKVIEGDNHNREDSFLFRLSAQNHAPMPEGIEGNTMIKEIFGEGETEFGSITFNRPGTYHYVINEVDNNISHVIYDKSAYSLTIDVVEADGKLVVASQMLEKDGKSAEYALFTNVIREVQDSGVVVVEGRKTWVHGDNDPYSRPQSVTVVIKANGIPIIQHAVTAADKWSWSFILDRYDENGQVIIYTVDEVAVPGYVKTINGFNITNTFDPEGSGLIVDNYQRPDPSNPGNTGTTGSNGYTGTNTGDKSGQKAGAPQTSDNSDMPSWILLLVASGLGLVGLQVWRFVQKRRGRW